jgi:hypothetical protein
MVLIVKELQHMMTTKKKKKKKNCLGNPSTSIYGSLLAKVKNVIQGNHRLTAQEVTKEIGISISLCHTVLMEDLGMHQLSSKFVPRLLTDHEKLPFSICKNLQILLVTRCVFTKQQSLYQKSSALP